jgi:hypothetical protein
LIEGCGDMNTRKVILFVIPSLILTLGVNEFMHRQAAHRQRRTTQERFLNLRFSSVALRNGRIAMTPERNFFPSFDYKQTRVLAIGDKFAYRDRHWHSTYTIKSIEPDGVVVSVYHKRDGADWSFSVKVTWK